MAGKMYQLLCTATVADGIQSTPVLQWKNSSGSLIATDSDIQVGPPTSNSLALEFNVIRVIHSGQYTCEATLYTLALESPLTSSAVHTVDIDSKCGFVISFPMFSLTRHISLITLSYVK